MPIGLDKLYVSSLSGICSYPIECSKGTGKVVGGDVPVLVLLLLLLLILVMVVVVVIGLCIRRRGRGITPLPRDKKEGKDVE